ncbi:nickel pincer cofactor biosynthesis protein LarC [Candidatus Nitrosotenuis uzonensis]|uniref:Nickel pincer cofactor biosynthesis protein LarC n=1 Tax=Candidatus Nitrosotenuis uzonensis TaxID=1407055 RepID=A0A812F4D1_9ARCH|nr:nickel pincer cofactor biosynthesis protein LarC [Candidatus Nitrosotenuis uzonensis]CAE6494039.1 conserved hypothetical protein [Candidatus Nitrosotenuis uzonensis]
MVLVIDSQIAGISGDMMLSSLVHIGANKSKIIDSAYFAQDFLPGSKIKKISFGNVYKHGIHATALTLKLDEVHHERKGTEIAGCIAKTARKIGLSQRAQEFAENTIQTLIGAEAKVHGISKNSVHFHEASSIDTVIDIIGCAIALDDLKCFDQEIVATPVAVGSGTVTFSHGTVSNPAGAILEIFKKSKILVRGSSITDELTTPTGASILVNLADRCSEFYPQMKISSIGYGAGQKNFDGISNVLKIVRGDDFDRLQSDRVGILETNLDDVSGELLAHSIDKIMSAGAKDVTVIPAVTKKGRPSHVMSVICDPSQVDRIADLIFSETGTLGVRIRFSDRIIVPRKLLTLKIMIRGKEFKVRCKIREQKQFKVEYDDIKSVSDRLNLPFKDAEDMIKTQVGRQLK